MGADCDVLSRLVQLNLLISMGKVKRCKSLASCQQGKQIVDERKRILVKFGHPVNGNFIITADSDTSVALDDRDNRGCPLRKLHGLYNALCLEPIQLCLNFLPLAPGELISLCGTRVWPSDQREFSP